MEELVIMIQGILDLQDSRMQHFQEVLRLQEANERLRLENEKLRSKLTEVESLKNRIEEMRSTMEGLINGSYSPEELELLQNHYGI